MVFIVCFITLLIERFFDWSHLRQWQWFYAWQRLISERIPKLSAYAFLAITILTPVILLVLITWLIQSLFYGFLLLLIELAIVLYCLGPRNLWADIFACVNAFIQADESYALEKLKVSFALSTSAENMSLHRDLTARFFIAANNRVFALIFWYSILGLGGAVIYRMIELTADVNSDQSRSKLAAQIVKNILDWIPVRILAFLFALGGHFVQVVKTLRQYLTVGITHNETLLVNTGLDALSMTDINQDDGSLERNAVYLVDRALAIYLVFIAIATVII